MKFLPVLLLTLISTHAFADVSFTCKKIGYDVASVYLSDDESGFKVNDRSDALVGEQSGLKAKTSNHGDSLSFTLNTPTSAKKIYTFSGFKVCDSEGQNRKAALTISNKEIGQDPMVTAQLSCFCMAD